MASDHGSVIIFQKFAAILEKINFKEKSGPGLIQMADAASIEKQMCVPVQQSLNFIIQGNIHQWRIYGGDAETCVK